MSILIVLLSLGLLFWLGALAWTLRNAGGILAVEAAQEFPLEEHPRVSILIPARNEAAILEKSLPRFLEQDYDNYEVLLVDDGSTDGTPQLAEKFQKRYPGRLRVIRVEELPEGWNGKIHALHQAFREATGEWILATDADIVVHPRALRAGLWLAGAKQAELVTIFAFVECVSFWEKLMLPGFSFLLASAFPFRKINDTRSSVAVASGGYILMRRQIWAGLGGYEAIRHEMIDDLNTARIVKHSGRRIFAAVTKDLLSTRMYESFGELWEGLRKHAFAGNRYSVARLLGSMAGSFLVNALPLATLFYGATRLFQPGVLQWQDSWLWVAMALALAQYLLHVILHAPFVWYLGVGIVYAFLSPLGSLVYIFISLDSMARTLLGKGVSWKERRYGKPFMETRI
jgi:chlorobactene glucosyltransferase